MTVAVLMAVCGVLFEPLGGGIFFLMVLVVLPVFFLRLRPFLAASDQIAKQGHAALSDC